MARFAKFLDIPPTLVSSEPAIELWGNKQITIEGCKGILEYGENMIRVSCGKYAVTVSGSSLELKNMTDNSCLITGVFEGLAFGV